MSSNFNMDAKLKASLENFKMLQMNINKNGKKKASKNYLKKGDIIEESKEEYTGRKGKRHIKNLKFLKKVKIAFQTAIIHQKVFQKVIILQKVAQT